jgi:hypothetical protein
MTNRPPARRNARLAASACLLIATIPLQADWTGAAPALAKPRQPDPPRSRPRIYEPDDQACQASSIESAFHQHLRPWADQPEEVQARLRQLQGEMTRTSLSRCVSKGLMTAEQARDIEARLGLPPALGRPSGPSTQLTLP